MRQTGDYCTKNGIPEGSEWLLAYVVKQRIWWLKRREVRLRKRKTVHVDGKGSGTKTEEKRG